MSDWRRHTRKFHRETGACFQARTPVRTLKLVLGPRLGLPRPVACVGAPRGMSGTARASSSAGPVQPAPNNPHRCAVAQPQLAKRRYHRRCGRRLSASRRRQPRVATVSAVRLHCCWGRVLGLVSRDSSRPQVASVRGPPGAGDGASSGSFALPGEAVCEDYIDTDETSRCVRCRQVAHC